jgi:hypothetical protein
MEAADAAAAQGVMRDVMRSGNLERAEPPQARGLH